MRAAEQTQAMLASLSSQGVGLQLGIIRHIGRPDQTPMIERWLPDDPARLLGLARYDNVHREANVYIRPSPQDAHPWLFLDDVELTLAGRIAKKYAALVVETSPGNCQLRLLADRPLSPRERSTVQAGAVQRLGGAADRHSTAGVKWGRLAGFRDRKPGRDGWVNLIDDSTATSRRFDPTLYLSSTPRQAVLGSVEAGKQEVVDGAGGYRNEFAYACHCLRRGESREKIVQSIAAHALARGKRHSIREAEHYASTVVDAARMRLW